MGAVDVVGPSESDAPLPRAHLVRPAAMNAHAAGSRRWRTVAAAASDRRCKGSSASWSAIPSRKGRFPSGGGGSHDGPLQEHNAGHGDHCEGHDRSLLTAAAGGARAADWFWTFLTPVWVMF